MPEGGSGGPGLGVPLLGVWWEDGVGTWELPLLACWQSCAAGQQRRALGARSNPGARAVCILCLCLEKKVFKG